MPEILIDGVDFVIQTRDSAQRELFRARFLGQRRVDAVGGAPADVTWRSGPHRIEFSDLEGDARIEVWSHGVTTRILWPTGSWYSEQHADRTGDHDDGYLHYLPRSVYVSERSVMFPEIDWQVGAMERLCEAAIATGNPIVWC